MRTPRLYAPGAVFHVVSKTQGQAYWLTPTVQHECLRMLGSVLTQSDVRLFAFGLMTTHLHLLVEQGADPLYRFCQRLLHRLSILIQRTHAVEGHVFQRRYRAKLCADAEHTRNALVYVHLNAWDAAMCDDPCDYPWHSHHLYLPQVRAASVVPIPAEDVLQLFKRSRDESIEQARANYLAHVREVMRRRQRGECDVPEVVDPKSPLWYPVVHDIGAKPPTGKAGPATSPVGHIPPDWGKFAEVAAAIASEIVPNPDMQLLCGRHGGRKYSEVRRAVIQRLHLLGYHSRDIAAFLELSPSRVCKVIAELKNRRPGP